MKRDATAGSLQTPGDCLRIESACPFFSRDRRRRRNPSARFAQRPWPLYLGLDLHRVFTDKPILELSVMALPHCDVPPCPFFCPRKPSSANKSESLPD